MIINYNMIFIQNNIYFYHFFLNFLKGSDIIKIYINIFLKKYIFVYELRINNILVY